jgi:hypothetical protein
VARISTYLSNLANLDDSLSSYLKITWSNSYFDRILKRFFPMSRTRTIRQEVFIVTRALPKQIATLIWHSYLLHARMHTGGTTREIRSFISFSTGIDTSSMRSLGRSRFHCSSQRQKNGEIFPRTRLHVYFIKKEQHKVYKRYPDEMPG